MGADVTQQSILKVPHLLQLFCILNEMTGAASDIGNTQFRRALVQRHSDCIYPASVLHPVMTSVRKRHSGTLVLKIPS